MKIKSSPHKAQIISQYLELTHFSETGLKFIQTHQSNTVLLDKFLNTMAELSDLVRTVKADMAKESSSTNYPDMTIGSLNGTTYQHPSQDVILSTRNT